MMILFLAGTSDARELALYLQGTGYKLLATVVTDSAASSLQQAGINYHVGRLSEHQMVDLANEIGATMIVDASHPFAEEASKTAMRVSEVLNILYVRYEREQRGFAHPLITELDTYEEAALEAKRRGGTILLTTGSKTLATFTKHLQVDSIRLLARMLPNIENMEKCAQLNVPQRDIIAMQGPFSKELNRALYKQYEVTLMITKESGQVGSIDEKMEAALEENIEILLIKRPRIQYTHHYSTFEEIKNHITNWGN
jgi:precorrin-6A/cobalt-precorrin-6A reductase